MIPLAEAWSRLLPHLAPLAGERVDRRDARGRVLSAPLAATVDVPADDVSAMDGYALAGAVEAGGRRPVAGTVAAGDPPGLVLPAGAAARIMTGAPVPYRRRPRGAGGGDRRRRRRGGDPGAAGGRRQHPPARRDPRHGRPPLRGRRGAHPGRLVAARHPRSRPGRGPPRAAGGRDHHRRRSGAARHRAGTRPAPRQPHRLPARRLRRRRARLHPPRHRPRPRRRPRPPRRARPRQATC